MDVCTLRVFAREIWVELTLIVEDGKDSIVYVLTRQFTAMGRKG